MYLRKLYIYLNNTLYILYGGIRMVIKKGSYIAKVCKRTSTGEALIIRFPKQLGKVNDVFQVYVKKLDNENS